ncbi:MAG: Asp-tRNA(Asn)/Glu-tRNA(Gln) amidotransferase subunit GatC [Bacilli bacterium]|jgi:aspartyl-tRNA(Asn)/glutamyl-tRNA(Gln) amidotransferase subunit C
MGLNKERIKDYAASLFFKLEEEELELVEKDLKRIEEYEKIINKVAHLEEVEPLAFPFSLKDNTFREDEVKEILSTKEALKNAKEVENNEIRIPKVVG